MRNLKLLKSFRSSELLGPGSPQCLALRADTGSLLAASQYSIVEYDPRTGQVVSEASLTAQGFLPGDGSGLVVGLEDLAELESACLATAGGDVVLFNLNTCQLECVGSVDSGLTSMSWSPDEELVVLTTGQETIIMMTKDFEPITEVGIHQDDFGEGKFITVGWGKKETQFHGSEGKQSAQRKIQEVQPAAAWDGGRPRVTWRGDGQLFAVSSICLHTGARRVRVWNREGVLQATSEAIDGLEEALCWKPSGSLIASTRRHPNKHSVVFLEKNGLLHGDFTLPLGRDRAKVKDLLWNSDSSVLAVWLEDMAAGEDKRVSTCIQLWVVGNYHWYLKQSLDFGRDPQKAPACVCWDPESPLRLQVVTRGWSSITYDWGWTTERSPGLDAADSASVAVIDGDKVLVTTFRQGVVPPPMCSFALQLPSPVNQVSFHGKPPRTNQLAALTSDGHISVYVEDSAEQSDSPSDGFRTVSRPLVLQKTFRVEAGGQEPLALRQLLWLDEDLFVAVISGLLPTSSTVLVLRPAGDADHALAVRREVEVDGVVVSMAHGLQTGTVALQLEDGRIRKLLWDCPDPSVEEWCDASGRGLSLPAPCAQTALCSIGGEERLLGLTDRSHLYAGDTELASNVSSFAVCGDFLLVTTHSHSCRCLQLHTLGVQGLQAALASGGGQNDETLRRVERGSRIVTVVPQDTRVVLQMPRGNLETVHHRSLVLAQLRSWLDSLRFRDAFECMRKLRINLNFLYDHNPKVFLENIRTFISELNSTANINLFLTELREEDTTSSMYPRPDGATVQTQPVAAPKKVDVVCDALRIAMETLDPNKYFLSILTSHVKKTVPELETALQKVHELRVKPPESPGSVGAEEALKYLLFLVNVNDLYEHSLGTYDFDLVLMVAEKSQKDPKEYLPFLNMLKSLEQNYQRYTIDRHLKRYRKALQHLSKCGDEHFPEALQLVREQKLYAEALRLYTADSPHYKALSCAYAEHLVEQHQAEQAGLLLWRCGELTGALQAFVSSSSWRNAVCVAQQIPLPPEHLALLARDLAAKLTEQRRHAEAAVLLDQYAKDCEEAILALITGACWEEALRLIHSHGRHDITETNLKPALLEAVGTQSAFLDARVATFTRHRARLAVVREQKAKARLDMLEEDGLDCPDAELYSEASSVLTASKYSHSNSRISSRSSKNRRKAERKKLSLKEGSPMEDRALVLALSELVTTVDKMREEVSSLLKALVLFQYQRQAEALQLAFQQALQSMEAAVPEVWPEGPQSARAPLTGPNSTANSITASFQQQQSPSASQQDADFLAPPKIRHCVKWRLSILT
uniref:Elongator complex protein 1 n=1 Tax=Tetraodon nigroviridis TaxID=99883 RepID=H3D601_TETNG